MDREIFEARIDMLEVAKKKLDDQIVELQRQRTELHGAVMEMWRWWEKHKDDGEFGSVRYDGRTKIHVLPTLGSPETVEQAIAQRLDAQVPGDAAVAKAARIDRGKQDAQKAVDQIHEWNEGQPEDGRPEQPGTSTLPEIPDDLWTKFRD